MNSVNLGGSLVLARLLLALCLGLAVALPAAAEPFASDRISVTVEGSGPDVVLVPGLTSSPEAWRSSAAALPGYRYHFVQVKGFAGTPAEGNAKGDVVASAAEEIARYIAEGKLDRPALLGHSMGGTIGLMVAARHPALISKLMVVDQIPFMGAMFGPPGTTAESVKPIADATVAGMRSGTPEERRKRMETMLAGMVANEAMRPAVMRSAVASDPEVTLSAFRELIVTDLRPELAKIAVPTTVLYVTPRGVPLTDAQIDAGYKAWYASLDGVNLVRIPDSAHFIMFDNPERFRAEMKAFLAR